MSVAQGNALLLMLERMNYGLLDLAPPAGMERSVWKSSIALVRSYGIGQEVDGKLKVQVSDKIKIAMLAAQFVKDIKKVSQILDWKDFESFVSEIAEQNGYSIRSNVNLTKPRVQIDLIAIKGSLAIAVDCKHWGKSAGDSSLAEIAEKQIRRARILLRSKKEAETWRVKVILPAIVTLLPNLSREAVKIPVVPVSEINSFLANVDGFIGDYHSIRKRTRTKTSF